MPTPSNPSPGYLARLWAALLGRTSAPTPPPAAEIPAQPVLPGPSAIAEASRVNTEAELSRACAELRGRVSVLEANLAEAEEKMARMRAEYAKLEEDKARAVAGAGTVELQRVFKKLAPPLAMLSTLTQKARQTGGVLASDLAEAVASVEKALAGSGLERIGEVGATVPYNAAVHARMSGGAANEGEPVLLQLPGYRLGSVVLHKAMVAVADKPGQTTQT